MSGFSNPVGIICQGEGQQVSGFRDNLSREGHQVSGFSNPCQGEGQQVSGFRDNMSGGGAAGIRFHPG